MALANSAAAQTANGAEWLTDYQEVARQSQLTGKPVLLKSDMAGCVYCRALEDVLKEKSVAARLSDFILYRLDLDEDPRQARAMGINAAPVLRLIAPTGARIDEHMGLLNAGEFIAWLNQAVEKGRLMTPSKVATDPKSVVARMGDPDPVLREIATQALAVSLASAENADLRTEVVEAFVEGNLSMRLGVLELLRQAGAPVGDVDPWMPETVIAAQDPLLQWAKEGRAVAEAPGFSAEEIERDLEVWINADEGTEARACYERLARAGAGLMPRVRELMPETWSRARERLTALQYRLLMPVEFAAEFPQVPFQMAARDPDVRMRAVDEVAKAVRIRGRGGEMEPFFLQVFTDPDARVREASLRGLRETGAGLAKQQVLKFLADPSPNVRAGILNDLAVSPLPDLDEDLKAYALKEEDDDLVVHAARALRRIRGRGPAFEGLLELTGHRSWRVRAEAVEAFGETTTWKEGAARLSPPQAQQVAKVMEKVLAGDDAFVVSKALEVIGSLENADLSGCLDELIALVERHPNLAEAAIRTIADQDTLRARAEAQIKALCLHKEPTVRAAAISALVLCTNASMKEELLTALTDETAQVRAAAANALCNWIETTLRRSRNQMAAVTGSSDTAGLVENVVPPDARAELVAVLRKNMASEDKDERFASLIALAALNDIDIAFPGIVNIVTEYPDLAADAVHGLKNLKYEDRKRLFVSIRGLPMEDSDWAEALGWLVGNDQTEAEQYFWDIFRNDPHIPAIPERALMLTLRIAKVEGGWWQSEPLMMPEGMMTLLTERAREQIASADPRRKVIGHILLMRVNPQEGKAAMDAVLDAHEHGESVDDLVYVACLQMRLASSDGESNALALKLLGSDREDVRKAAFNALLRRYALLEYPTAQVSMGEEIIGARFLAPSSPSPMYNVTPRQWEPPKLPDELTPAVVRPFLEMNDPEERNGAALLLAVLGDDSGMPVLLESWRNTEGASFEGLLLARAIATLDRDDDVRYVAEMYEKTDKDDRSDFGPNLYWSIRRMGGEQARELRRKMRKDLGNQLMQQ
jgi:HEAT repeat protein